MEGKIIVIEGTDCSGKETQSKLLVKRLNEMGYKAINLSFPMYDSPTGQIVSGPYLGRNNEKCWFPEGSVSVDPKIACLYYAADRKYNFPKIKKYIDDGYYVIIDRYVSSNMAHQGSKITDPDERFNLFNWIDKLEYWLLELPKPDITIFLHVPYLFSKELKKNRDFLDEHESSEEYLINTEKTYMELTGLYNWNKVECISDNKLRTIEDINEEIVKIVLSK